MRAPRRRSGPARALCLALAGTLALLGVASSDSSAAVRPTISALAANPQSVASGAATTVSASVSGATECVLSASKPVSGLPQRFACQAGSVELEVRVPTNSTRRPAKLDFSLKATGPGGSAKAKLAVSIAPAAPPAGQAMAIGAGLQDVCAVLTDGHVDCWGGGAEGQLGDGATANASSPVEVQSIGTATQVTGGFGHTCALLTDGSVDCWGRNEDGQLGDGATAASDVPVEVSELGDAAQIDANENGTCALRAGGAIECWGLTGAGDSPFGRSLTPIEAPGTAGSAQVAVGAGPFACALLDSHRVECWGDNEQGELGDGTTADSADPLEVQGLAEASEMSAGQEDACALLADGHVDCWGADQDGQLGDGTVTDYVDTPVAVEGLSEAVQVSVWQQHACALLSSGRVDCWGANAEGELGDGTRTAAHVPVEVEDLDDATSVTTGHEDSCALLATRHVECWGSNLDGRLGNGGHGKRSTVPVPVVGI